MKKIIKIIILSILSLQLSFLIINEKARADTKSQQIDILSSPEKILFNLKNLKPGDWSTRKLTVYNSGTKSYKYLVSMKIKSGSEKFFNELFLKVSDSNKVLYYGKMKDFSKLNPRSLIKNKSEKLFFKVEVPNKLGNEFQGLNCIVQFEFYVEGTIGGILPVNGPTLPETGTDMFNFIVVGAVLIIIGVVLIQTRKRVARKVHSINTCKKQDK